LSGQTHSGCYYRARYYHPDLQRFISEDPLEFDAGDSALGDVPPEEFEHLTLNRATAPILSS
jgi:hypothetical protein